MFLFIYVIFFKNEKKMSYFFKKIFLFEKNRHFYGFFFLKTLNFWTNFEKKIFF